MIDGLNKLNTMIIGENGFCLDDSIRKGNKYVIMNGDQLSEIHIRESSFQWYESFELRIFLLISIQLWSDAFHYWHSVIFESMMMNGFYSTSTHHS